MQSSTFCPGSVFTAILLSNEKDRTESHTFGVIPKPFSHFKSNTDCQPTPLQQHDQRPFLRYQPLFAHHVPQSSSQVYPIMQQPSTAAKAIPHQKMPQVSDHLCPFPHQHILSSCLGATTPSQNCRKTSGTSTSAKAASSHSFQQ
nr:hypothetical protein Iba_chr13eCG11480 [Ipomoea batatas]